MFLLLIADGHCCFRGGVKSSSAHVDSIDGVGCMPFFIVIFLGGGRGDVVFEITLLLYFFPFLFF